MGHVFLAIVVVLAIPPLISAQARCKFSAEDEAAIRRVVLNWDRGWDEGKAELSSADYADDADWINAFGYERKGKAEILAFLTKLYKNPDVRAGKSTKPVTTTRCVRPDVAITYTYNEIEGQKRDVRDGGGFYPKRKVRHTRVISKENGRWLTVSHRIMDDKEY